MKNIIIIIIILTVLVSCANNSNINEKSVDMTIGQSCNNEYFEGNFKVLITDAARKIMIDKLSDKSSEEKTYSVKYSYPSGG